MKRDDEGTENRRRRKLQIKRGGGFKSLVSSLFRAMISFSEAGKPSVVRKLRICQLFGNLSHE